jgi:hypothetical protein
MRYALLIYADDAQWTALPEAERLRQRREQIPGWEAVAGELAKVDPEFAGFELEPRSEAKVVRIREGQRLVTDGPFAETKEVIGGAFTAELPDLDEAIRLSALVPAARYGSVEIRPLVG